MDSKDLCNQTATAGTGLPPLPWDLTNASRRMSITMKAGELADAIEKYGRAVLALARSAPAPADERALAEWLSREMPAGTVIGDPAWWAPRIARATLAHQATPAQPEQPATSEAQPDVKKIVYVLMYLSANGLLAWRGSGDDEADAEDEAQEEGRTTYEVIKAMNAIKAQPAKVAPTSDQQAGAQPVATVLVTHKGYVMTLAAYMACALPEGTYKLYAAPAPAADQDALDAKRYRWLRDKSEPGICAFYLSVGKAFHNVKFKPETVDEAIDAQIATPAAAPVTDQAGKAGGAA